nr:uncharacterized protein LOC129380119 [Dermacentor andersoni]
MTEKNLLAVILLATTLTVLESKLTFFRRRSVSMHKFLDVKEPIWTYTTSRRTDILCEVDVVTNITASSVFFTRFSYDRKGRTSGNLEGIFNQRRKKYMLVHTQGGAYDLHEEVLYMSSDSSCAVIMVSRLFGGTFRSYDLRVIDSLAAFGPHKDCVRKFKKRDSRGQVIYRPQCSDILHNKTQAPLPKSGANQKPSTNTHS